MMAERAEFRLNLGTSVLLFVAAWAALLIVGFAQAPVGKDIGAGAPAYDIISIKPDKIGRYSWKNRSDGLSTANVSPLTLINDAYGPLLPGAVSGWTTWSTSARFDIEARMDEEAAAKLQKLAPKDQAEERQLILRSLLADRFQLRVHHETKTLPLYELVVAKGGPKM